MNDGLHLLELYLIHKIGNQKIECVWKWTWYHFICYL